MPRSKFDPNEIVKYDNYAEIVLYDKNNNEKARTLVDLERVDDISGVKWYQKDNGYVATNNYHGTGYAYLHTIIAGNVPKGMYVDHIDGNRLNNRIINLRVVTPEESGMNKGIRSDNESGRTGVHWSNNNQKWCVMICYHKKHINLGYFDKYEDAVRRREEAEREYFGQFMPESFRSHRSPASSG